MSATNGGGNDHKGKVQPDKGKVQPDKGKSEAIVGAVTAGAACVVLRASVETFGPAGDAELHFTVKWPGTTLATASETPCADDGTGCSGGGMDASGNLYLPATYPGPPSQS